MALTPTESQQLATLLSKVTSIEGLNTDLLTLIRSAGQGGAVDIATHNNDVNAHAAMLKALFGTKIRNRYTSAVNLYVRPDGNDNNDGLVDSAAGALKTLAGVQTWLRRADLSGYQANIIMSPGTYAGLTWKAFGIDCTAVIKSADSTNKAVIPTAMAVSDFARVEIQDVVFQNTLMADLFANVWAQNCDFSYQGASTGSIITAQRFSYLYLQPGCTISGTASNGLYATQLSMINNWGTLTFNGAVFSSATMMAERLGLIYSGATYDGNVTGRRFTSRYLALVDANNRGPNAILGTIDGTADAATGGFYR